MTTLGEIFSGSDWNISRMECKIQRQQFYTQIPMIGIYPEWNVKVSIRGLDEPFFSLEYIQNGM